MGTLTLTVIAVLQLLLTLLLLWVVWRLRRVSRDLLLKLSVVERRSRTRTAETSVVDRGDQERSRTRVEKPATRQGRHRSEVAESIRRSQPSPTPHQQPVGPSPGRKGHQQEDPFGAETIPDPSESRRYLERRVSETNYDEPRRSAEGAVGFSTEPSASKGGRHEVQPGQQPAPSWVGSLTEVWRDYRNNGNGFFHADGFKDFLQKHGIEATVLPGTEFVGSKLVVGVTEDGDDRTYLVPSFLEPLSAMQKWFDDEGSGDRTRRVSRIGHLAVLKKENGEYLLVERGAVS